MTRAKQKAVLRYSANTSASKEEVFVHKELAEQVQAGHAVVFPLSAVTDLPNLWIYPVSIIPQVGRRPRLIFNFTWSGLNQATDRVAPE